MGRALRFFNELIEVRKTGRKLPQALAEELLRCDGPGLEPHVPRGEVYTEESGEGEAAGGGVRSVRGGVGEADVGVGVSFSKTIPDCDVRVTFWRTSLPFLFLNFQVDGTKESRNHQLKFQ